MKTHPPVVLLGTDCLNGLQTSRILWRHHVPVIGVADDCSSPYCRTRSAVQTIDGEHFRNHPRAVLTSLQKQYNAPRLVALACTDEFVWWMNNERELIAEHADFLMAPFDSLQLLVDKVRFYRYCIENNLPLTETRFVTTVEELEAAGREMRFPLVLKPPLRSPEWMQVTGGEKVIRVDDAESLLKEATPLLPTVDELILQTWIRGPDSNMHSLYVCMDQQSRLLGCLVLKKIRLWPPDIGVGCSAEEADVPEVKEIGLPILQKLNYAGPGSLQFQRDEVDGKFYILEMNAGRTVLNYPVCEACGMEIVYTYHCAAAGLPLPEARTIIRPGSKWVCWKSDFASACALWCRGELTIGEWISSLRGNKWSADIQLDDPVPAFADIARKMTRDLFSSARKISKHSTRRAAPASLETSDTQSGERNAS